MQGDIRFGLSALKIWVKDQEKTSQNAKQMAIQASSI
jgi:hypothetical protein